MNFINGFMSVFTLESSGKILDVLFIILVILIIAVIVAKYFEENKK